MAYGRDRGIRPKRRPVPAPVPTPPSVYDLRLDLRELRMMARSVLSHAEGRRRVQGARPAGIAGTVGLPALERAAQALSLLVSDLGDALDALDRLEDAGADAPNAPCAECGRDDLPLHFNRRCPECWPPRKEEEEANGPA